jgi:hypothetical protein
LSATGRRSSPTSQPGIHFSRKLIEANLDDEKNRALTDKLIQEL